MLLRLALLAVVPVVLAQQNVTFLAGLSQILQDAGVHAFQNAVAQLNGTTTGESLLTILSDGKNNLTLFVPNDSAFTGLIPNISTNPQLFADTIAYHIVSGNFNNETATFPNVTIGRTYLNDSSVVTLDGGKPQVLAWSKFNDSNTRILNQNTEVAVTNTTSYGPIFINIINAIIDVPGYFSAASAQANLTGFDALLHNVQYTYYPPGANPTNTTYWDAFDAGGQGGVRGYTLFAPNDAALGAAAAELAGFAGNTTAMSAIVQNHFINGTSVYSPQLMDGSPNFTSSAGEQFTLNTNTSGTFVSSGTSQARLVKTDVLVNNGVIHVIDAVLLNVAENSGAASSAYSSATSAAAHSTTETGPVGSPTSSSSSNGDVRIRLEVQHAVALVGVHCNVGNIKSGSSSLTPFVEVVVEWVFKRLVVVS